MFGKIGPAGLADAAAALLLALVLLVVAGGVSGSTEPRYDGLFYVKMARQGLFPPGGLAAPFAYRPATPLLARAVSGTADLDTPEAFRVLAHAASAALLLGIFLFARWAGASRADGLAIMAALGGYYFHVKQPLYFPSLVDVEAYPLVLAAVWALLAGHRGLALALSCLGIFFKEFLVVPALLLVLVELHEWRRSGRSRPLGRALLALALAGACLAAPRLWIPVAHSFQAIDPQHRPETLARLLTRPLDPRRDLNLLFALLSYWLPTLMLLTRARARALWLDLGEWRALAVAHVALVSLLALYGGSNTTTFVAYALPFQALALALLLRRGVPSWEVALVLLAVLAYNKFPLPIPPLDGTREALHAHVDFYGGWSTRVNASSLQRWFQLALCLTLLPAARRLRR